MGLMGLMKSKPHFMNGLARNMLSILPLGCVKDFQFIDKHHNIDNVVGHPCEELATNTWHLAPSRM
jgi:hypothetical protein